MKILYLTSNLPYPANSGGAQRSALLLETLQAMGEVECVFLLSHPVGGELLGKLKKQCNVRLLVSGHPVSEKRSLFRRQISDLDARLGISSYFRAGRFRWQLNAGLVQEMGSLADFDLVVVRYLQVAATFSLFGKKPMALDVDDYDPARLSLRVEHSSWMKNLTLRRALRYSAEAHTSLIPLADHKWVSNPEDFMYPELSNAALLPNVPSPAAFKKAATVAPVTKNAESHCLVMVGSFDYSPNLDGISWFIRKVWSIVRIACPEATLKLVGRGIKERDKRWFESFAGICVCGFVDDLASVYGTCTATIAPMLAGGGTNIKVIESAAFARAPILTTIAYRGLKDSLQPEVECLLAHDATEMSRQCIRLLQDPKQAEEIGLAAQRSINARHSLPVFKKSVENGCEAAMRNFKRKQ